MFGAERTAVAGLAGVAIVDLTDAFCNASKCPPIIDGTVVYQDTNHMTPAFSAHLAPALRRFFRPRAKSLARD